MTLNQILKKIKDFADSHKQIQSYGIGRLSDEDIEGLQYPVCWNVIGGAIIENKVINISFTIYFFDRIKKDYSNENEVMSDMLSVATDFVAKMREVSQADKTWNFQTSAPLTPIGDATDDEASGWELQFTIRITHEYNSCQIPD